MTNTTEKDKVLLSLTMLTDLADENSNLPAMHQIRLLGNDLIDLITSEIVLVKSPYEDPVMAEPEPWVPPMSPQQVPPMQDARLAVPVQPAPWGTPPSALPTAAVSPFPVGSKLSGINKLRQTVFDLTQKDIGGYAAEILYTECQEPTPIPEDTLLLNALEDEMAAPDTRGISFDKGKIPGIDVRNSEGHQKAFFHGKAREALRALAEAHKPD